MAEKIEITKEWLDRLVDIVDQIKELPLSDGGKTLVARLDGYVHSVETFFNE